MKIPDAPKEMSLKEIRETLVNQIGEEGIQEIKDHFKYLKDKERFKPYNKRLTGRGLCRLMYKAYPNVDKGIIILIHKYYLNENNG